MACHKLNGAGNQIGPDLTKLDPMLKPIDVLRDLLEPSAKINEQFATYIIETNSGKVVTGLIVGETSEGIKLIENPLVKTEVLEIKLSDIAERTKSPTSIMPKGLLDKLNREEILDLVAYVMARGDEHDKVFHGGHDHAGH